MSIVTEPEYDEFFAAVNEASANVTWCALATIHNGAPKVRMVHPTWEGDVLWIATGATTAKAKQLASNPSVDIQYQVAPPNFVHVMVSGTAELLDDPATREHVWQVMDYDLNDFWPEGPTTEDFVAIKITPNRVELSEMFGTVNKRVWRRQDAS